MGFDCGFEAVKKFKEYTIKDYIEVEKYIYWKSNPWNFEDDHYPTYKKYWTSFYNDKEEDYPGEPNEELVEFYTNNRPIKLFEWGSWSFRDVDDEICLLLKKIDDYDYYLDGNKEPLLEYISDFIDDNRLISVSPIKSIVNMEDEDNGDYEITKNIDGVVLSDEDGNYKYFYNDYEYLYQLKNEDRYYISQALISFKAKLEMLNLNDYDLYYWRSY